jgi:hypothetical protein
MTVQLIRLRVPGAQAHLDLLGRVGTSLTLGTGDHRARRDDADDAGQAEYLPP